MASKGIKISIATALNNAGINATRSQINSLAKSLKGSMGEASQGVRRHMADIKAGFDMVAASARKLFSFITSALRKAFDAEYMQTNFKTLLGSVDKAKSHIAELKKFASETPLTLGDLSGASRLLLSFGVNINEIIPSLKMLGDISMGNSEKFRGLALVFAQVKSAGKLMGQDLLQMINQGFNPLVEISKQTGASISELRDMMSKGCISFEMVQSAMESATSEGGRFNNAMKDASKTGNGLISTLKDNWTMAVTSFGDAFSVAAKDGISVLIEKIQSLNNDGTVDVWANKTCEAVDRVVKAAKKAGEWIGNAVERYKRNVEYVTAGASGIGAYIGTLYEGGSFSDAKKAMGAVARQTYREIEDNRKESEQRDQQIMSDAWRKSRIAAYERDKEAAIKANSEKKRSMKELYEEQKKLANAEEYAKDAAKKLKTDFADYLASGSTDTFVKWREDTGREMEAARAEFDRLFGNATVEATVTVKTEGADAAAKEVAAVPDSKTATFTVKTENKSDKQAEEKTAAEREKMFAKWFKKRKEDERKAREEEAKKRKKETKELAEFELLVLKRLHDDRMAQLDAEAKKLYDQIRALEAVGADNVMARAGGGIHGRGTMDQAEDERARRQRIKDNIRAIDAEQKLREKMEKSGATLDNAEEKMGRLSNLEKATLDKMRLDRARKDAEKIQKERDDREKQMATDLSAINKRLVDVGL